MLAIGAHPDDIEIGAGRAAAHAGQPARCSARYVVLTGTAERQQEARNAARAFLPDADLTVDLFDLPEGRLPAVWADVKEILERHRAIVLTRCHHRAVISTTRIRITGPSAEIVPTVFRDQLYLAYEIPKWDGDIGRPSVYVPLSAETASRKVELLHKCYPSQRGRDWWDDEVFLGLARLRGMECRAPYAEAFSCTKSVIAFVSTARDTREECVDTAPDWPGCAEPATAGRPGDWAPDASVAALPGSYERIGSGSAWRRLTRGLATGIREGKVGE